MTNLTNKLARSAAPVRPLASPALRAGLWLVVALLLWFVPVLLMGAGIPLLNWQVLSEMLLGYTAAYLALASVSPHEWKQFEKYGVLAIAWLVPSALEYVTKGWGAFDFSISCFAGSFALFLPLFLVLLWLLLRGMPMNSLYSCLAGGLAAAAFGSAAMRQACLHKGAGHLFFSHTVPLLFFALVLGVLLRPLLARFAGRPKQPKI